MSVQYDEPKVKLEINHFCENTYFGVKMFEA